MDDDRILWIQKELQRRRDAGQFVDGIALVELCNDDEVEWLQDNIPKVREVESAELDSMAAFLETIFVGTHRAMLGVNHENYEDWARWLESRLERRGPLSEDQLQLLNGDADVRAAIARFQAARTR